MKRRRWALLVLALGLLAAGCAGIIEPRVPEEFKGRKIKEDPPLNSCLPVPWERRA